MTQENKWILSNILSMFEHSWILLFWVARLKIVLGSESTQSASDTLDVYILFYRLDLIVWNCHFY